MEVEGHGESAEKPRGHCVILTHVVFSRLIQVIEIRTRRSSGAFVIPLPAMDVVALASGLDDGRGGLKCREGEDA